MMNGTLVNYYIHCKRQCYLHGNRINLEDNSEDVKIGKAIHEIKAEGKDNAELSIDSIKIDKITKDYLVEIKKSDADLEAVKWQVYYYLKVLKTKGIIRKGKIEVVEKKKSDHKVIYVELDEQIEQQLKEIEEQIQELISGEIPEVVQKKEKCKKCAYYEYCHI